MVKVPKSTHSAFNKLIEIIENGRTFYSLTQKELETLDKGLEVLEAIGNPNFKELKKFPLQDRVMQYIINLWQNGFHTDIDFEKLSKFHFHMQDVIDTYEKNYYTNYDNRFAA